jgi:hypothetical protein
MKTPEELSAILRRAGAKGGRAGIGKAKTRSKLHYQRAGALGALARWGKKQKKPKPAAPSFPALGYVGAQEFCGDKILPPTGRKGKRGKR